MGKTLFLGTLFFLGIYSFASVKPNGQQRNLTGAFSATEWFRRCSSEINDRIAGKKAKEAITWRNENQYLPTSWAYGLNLTAVSIARASPRGVAVTPRHLLFTKHYGWHAWPGQTIKFLTLENQVVSRVVDQVKYLGSANNSNFEMDVAVVRLTEDLPPSISPMKLVARSELADVAKYSCPILRIDQENKALIVLSDMFPGDFSSIHFSFFQPRTEPYAPFYEPMVLGDSTSSSILLYKDLNGVTPFLVSQVTFGGAGSGPNLSTLADDIQATIDSFGDTESQYRLGLGPGEFPTLNPSPPIPTCSLDVVYRKTGKGTGSCTFNLAITNNNIIRIVQSVSSVPRKVIAQLSEKQR